MVHFKNGPFVKTVQLLKNGPTLRLPVWEIAKVAKGWFKTLWFWTNLWFLLFLNLFQRFRIRFWCKTYLFFLKNSYLGKFLARAHFCARCALEISDDLLKMSKNSKIWRILTFSMARAQNCSRNEIFGKNRCVLQQKRMQNIKIDN